MNTSFVTPQAPGSSDTALGSNNIASDSNDIEQADNEAMLLYKYTSSKVLHLTNFPRENCWYFHTTEKYVLEDIPGLVDKSETAVAFSRLGDGYVGYIGDTNYDIGPTRSIMANANQQKPVILLLCLGDKWMTDMLDDPQAFGSLGGALKYLNENRPDGILITDPGVIAPKNREILGRLTAFAQSGGTVVFSFCFASNINRDNMDRLWRESWNIPWTMGDYHRRPGHQQRRPAIALYSQKAVHLDGVSRENCWYLPTNDSHVESMVFPPDRIANQAQTPVAFSRVGDGHVGYTGDVNQESGTNMVLLRMFNLVTRHVVEEL
ncbi:hypothetical protein PG984_003523 [Apiospora sp. TS-2023a]